MSSKNKHLNIITQLLAYDSENSTDNPVRRHVDWSRRMFNIQINDPESLDVNIEPSQLKLIFDGTRNHGLVAGSSSIDITFLSAKESRYRISTDEADAFRTSRSVTGLADADVTINNNSVAKFDFGAADLSAVQVGDTMRIKSKKLFDPSPYAFSPLNGGYWTVLSVSGSVVQVKRLQGCSFEAVAESVTGVSGDVEFFSTDGVQIDDKIKISGTLSSVSHRTYTVLDANPQYVDIVSSHSLPEESGLTYESDSIVFYTESKRLLYIESDQEVSVRINGSTEDNILVTPVEPGSRLSPGYFHMWGEIYKLEILNKSVNNANVLCIKGE